MNERPDYPRWLRKTAWRLDDAVFIVLGIDPGSYPSPRIRPRGVNLRMRRSPPNVFWDFLDVAMKSEGRDLDVLEYSSENVSGAKYAKVQPVAFANWAKHAGCKIPDELVRLLDEQEPQLDMSKVDQRVEHIRRAVRNLDYEPLAIRTGGKKKVEKVCLEDSMLFTPSTFEKAWRVAVNRKVVRMEQHDKFSNA